MITRSGRQNKLAFPLFLDERLHSGEENGFSCNGLLLKGATGPNTLRFSTSNPVTEILGAATCHTKVAFSTEKRNSLCGDLSIAVGKTSVLEEKHILFLFVRAE